MFTESNPVHPVILSTTTWVMPAQQSAWERVQQRMNRLGLREEQLREQFVLGSGSGGQKVNKSANSVSLTHLPTGRTVKCGEARSQHLNRILARERMCDAVEEEREQRRQDAAARRARIRYQQRKPSARASATRVQSKRKKGEVKRLRSRPSSSD